MASEMAEAMEQLILEKGYTKAQVVQIIENMLKAAYKKTFGTNENAIVVFNDDQSDVEIYARKVVVDGVYDPVTEIEFEEAKELTDEVEIGDEIDILLDPKNFERSAVQTGKNTAHQALSEIKKSSLSNEYHSRIGEIVSGNYIREDDRGSIYIDLGNNIEGCLPKKNQSPSESFQSDDRVKAIISDVKTYRDGVQIILSRSSVDFVKALFTFEVPEISDGIVEINNIVREAGYRTKVAVSSNRIGVEPVGSCVGEKGIRIQTIKKELFGERIDIIPYDSDAKTYISNALSPAKVTAVAITDKDKRTALAVVPDDQLANAIGAKGVNIRLANRLTNWLIDVQSESQCENFDSILEESRKAAKNLFSDEVIDESEKLSAIDGIEQRVLDLLKENNITTVDSFDNASADGSLQNIEGLTDDDIDAVSQALDDWENGVEENTDASTETQSESENENEATEEDYEIEYECPECGAKVTEGMTVCPNCGIEISFEEDEE